MMVEFRNKYRISSNKESGLGRYDIMLEPKEKGEDTFIIEFKVCYPQLVGTIQLSGGRRHVKKYIWSF
jgi:hypothetical protein